MVKECMLSNWILKSTFKHSGRLFLQYCVSSRKSIGERVRAHRHKMQLDLTYFSIDDIHCLCVIFPSLSAILSNNASSN